MTTADLHQDHHSLGDTAATRRYFAKFERIIAHTRDVAATVPRRGKLAGAELAIIEQHLKALSKTFTALSYKHLFAARKTGIREEVLEIDRLESGFPIYSELLRLANDALQVDKHLKGMQSQQGLKRDMVRHILQNGMPPTKLQYTMSQRIYYEAMPDEYSDHLFNDC